ncbi:MAG: O-antigen ligase family protein [Lutisporaceae bacterium]
MIDNRYIKYLILAMTIFSVTIYWGAYASAVIAFFIVFINNRKLVIAFVIEQKPIIFLAVSLILSTIFSRTFSNSLIIDAILLLHLLAFIVLVVGTRLEELEGLFKLLNTLAICLCIYGIYQYLTGDLAINKSWTDQKTFGSLVRIYSTMRNPNIFAGYLVFNISYASAYLIKKKSDIYTAINILLSSICLILTYSRGGFIAFIAAMLVIMVLCREWKVAVYLVIMGILYYSYNMIGNLNRADLGLLNTDSSSLYRMEIWKASFNLFLKNIAFGSGPGSVMKYLSFSSAKLKGFIMHSHNIPIHLFAETGLVGFTSFTVIIFTCLKKFISFWKEHRDSSFSYIAVGFAASITALMVHGLVDCVIFVPTRSIVFLIYLSLFPILLYNMRKLSLK